jgi:HD-GYP domain-containing protein (c-di-GMP phosphodiesterase class II)
MLKRIAVAGADAGVVEGFGDVAGPEFAFVAPRARKALPINTVAAMGSLSDAEPLVKLAAAIGRQHDALLLLVGEALDVREGMPAGASARVLDHATRFAGALDLDSDQTLTLERGALLREIGKLRIANDVLLKKTLLTYDEWALIHAHTRLGAELVAAVPGLADLEPLVRSHHECYDGTGYPDKLEGEDIPLLARIMKILDVYCAMTSPRHYRTTISSHDDALVHLRHEQGKHFDPALVDVFIDRQIARTE